ncbi:hypothetical protein F66182_4512 [Fusarium sp. NRRL 66182]|nr:hypothetical protein F66182_4512 [Fusarium sp. NRRL 66182]
MRSQKYTSVTIPIPGQIPPQVVVDYLQTYVPILQHNPGIVSYRISTLDHDMINGDSFFNAHDPQQSLRCYEADDVVWLSPGCRKSLRWPVTFQSISTGAVCRADAPAGLICWTQWSVQPRQADAATAESVSTPSTATPPSLEENEWELYGGTKIEANSMLLPWCISNTRSLQISIGQGIINDVCAKHGSGMC